MDNPKENFFNYFRIAFVSSWRRWIVAAGWRAQYGSRYRISINLMRHFPLGSCGKTFGKTMA